MKKGEESIKHFLGKEDYPRINCAQAFASVFSDVPGVDKEMVHQFRKMGVGKAPRGECGILYGGREVLRQAGREDLVEPLEALFLKKAGSFDCKSIRKKKIPFCAKVLGESVDFVDSKLFPLK